MGEQQGAIWKKWDLHVHTPASMVQNYGGDTDDAWEKFYQDIESLPSDFKVLGINDYIFIDGYEKVLKAKDSGRLKNIDLILPVIELRLDKFAGVMQKDSSGQYSKSDWNRINLHIIFDQLDPEIIRQQFLNSLVSSFELVAEAKQHTSTWQAVVTKASLIDLGNKIIEAAPVQEKSKYGDSLEVGFNNICFSLDKVKDVLKRHNLANRFLLAIGKTEWANMKWNDHSIAEKRNVINCAHLVFTASDSPASYNRAKEKLQSENVNCTLLDCSDAHAFSTSENKDRIGNCFTWVKADTTFQGLQQAIHEFEDRVFIGDTPPKQLIVDANRTKYISKIKIFKNKSSISSETWFDMELLLNSDLVAVIGNKGSGKSALTDAIALAGNTKNFKSFSFLSAKRFRNTRKKFAENYSIELTWADGRVNLKPLDEDPLDSSVERVKYLPQSHLENLCNELSVSDSPAFNDELREIIYTHVPIDQRIGCLSLKDLLDFKISALEEDRQRLVSNLLKLNSEIVTIENNMSAGFKKSLEEQLAIKRKELSALEDAKPLAIEDPNNSEIFKKEAVEITTTISTLETGLYQIKEEENSINQKKIETNTQLAHLIRAKQSLTSFQNQYNSFADQFEVELSKISPELNINGIVKFEVDTKNLDLLHTQLKSALTTLETTLSSPDEGSIRDRRTKIELQLTPIKAQLGEKQRIFLLYKEQFKQWEAAKADLLGNKHKPHSISWFEEELKNLEKLPNQLQVNKEKRCQIVRELHALIVLMVSEYRTLYEPVQSFVQSAQEMSMSLPLDFNVQIVSDGFSRNFLDYINRQSRGSFSGVEESEETINKILNETDFMDVEAVLRFVVKIDEMLHKDMRDSENSIEVNIKDQLRKGKSSEDLYNFLFSLQYLHPQYSLTYNDQEISELSPGERGLLLLVFYLLVDKDDIPLIIDQPEENLDNQTIYKVLVTCIKAAKKRRQVIMVTHNPNLAVVCDAEQIIYATCDKTTQQFFYVGGAIESEKIKQYVIEILEGTKPAFDNRKNKYDYGQVYA